MSRLLLLSASASLLAAAAHAQSPSLPRCKVFSVDHVTGENLRKGFANAATDGYRVIAAGGNCAVLEQRPKDAAREADGTPPRYQLVIAAEWAPNQSWVPRLERKLNEAASRGYHLIRGGVSIKRRNEVVAVMEKREAPLVEYRVLSAFSERGFAAQSWRALEQELLAASEQGWEYVALTGTTGQQPEPEWDSGRLFPSTVRAIVLERPAGRR